MHQSTVYHLVNFVITTTATIKIYSVSVNPKVSRALGRQVALPPQPPTKADLLSTSAVLMSLECYINQVLQYWCFTSGFLHLT